jgi:hypothetical protein
MSAPDGGRPPAEPAIVYEVAAWDDNDSPSYRAVFTVRALAEAYQAALPGADLEELALETEVPYPVTVHHAERYVITRDGVSILGLDTVPPYEIASWSHLLRDNRAHWSHADHNLTIRHTSEPDLKLVQVAALDAAAAQRVLAETEQRLKAEAAVRAIADDDA